LKELGVIRFQQLPVKVTGTGTLTRAVSCKGLRVTESAKKAIEKAGGTVA
jgi:large subunit ribosomal protein L15